MANKRIGVAYLGYMNSYWIYEESIAGTYKGETYYNTPRTIAYADTLEEADEIITEAERRIGNG